jgi:hypothetical protein
MMKKHGALQPERRHARLERMRAANPDLSFAVFETLPEHMVNEWCDLLDAFEALSDGRTKTH